MLQSGSFPESAERNKRILRAHLSEDGNKRAAEELFEEKQEKSLLQDQLTDLANGEAHTNFLVMNEVEI